MSRLTFGAAFATGATNLDLMRLAGALLVLASHSWILAGRADAEPFAPLLAHYADGGGLAVAMFFVLSGLLIARSALLHAPGDYIRARALRIYPAFAVAVLAQTFVVGLFATRLPWADYLGAGATWEAFARGMLMSPRAGLPGVFEANPLPGMVNGSLWTLRIEALCYAGLLLLALLGAFRRGWLLLALACGFAALGATMAARAGFGPAALAALRVTSAVDCGLHFLMGATFWRYRDCAPRRWWIVGACLLALALAAGTWAAPVVWHLALPYLTLWLGLSAPVAGRLLRRVGDISYGTYLYAFPLQQSIMAGFGGSLGPAGLALAAAPAALLCGLASCRAIEAPALRLRRRGRRLSGAPEAKPDGAHELRVV